MITAEKEEDWKIKKKGKKGKKDGERLTL